MRGHYAWTTVSMLGLAIGLATPAVAQDQPNATNTTKPDSSPSDIIVTARRTGENLQKVPVAVTVLNQAALDKHGTFRPDDLTAYVPGLVATAQVENRDAIIYSIRGQNEVYNTLFPAVITYFNEVPVTQLTSGAFFDMANVQVLRGPQGVLFGRVTDGGNVMMSPQKPKANFEGYVEGKAGDYGMLGVDGALNVPVIRDQLLVRVAFDVDHRDGFTKNIYDDKWVDNGNSQAVRVGITWKPTPTLENATIVQYQHTDSDGTAVELAGVNPQGVMNTASQSLGLFPGAYGINAQGNVVPFQPGLTPLTTASLIADLQSQLAHQQQLGPRRIDQDEVLGDRRRNLYLVNTTTANVTPDFQIKNIFGFTKVTEFEESNYTGSNVGLVLGCHDACANFTGYADGLPLVSQEQLSEELRLSGTALHDRLKWSAGMYADYQRPGGKFDKPTVELGVLDLDFVDYPKTREIAGSGWFEYDASDFVEGLKITGGLRYSSDTFSSNEAQYTQPIFPSAAVYNSFLAVAPFVLEAGGVPPATAAALAPGLAQATVFTPIPYGVCQTSNAGIFAATCTHLSGGSTALTWSAGLSYELRSGQLFYAKVSRGYRPGGVNDFAPAGISPAYAPEFDTSYEIGFKGDFDLGGMKLRTDLALFHDDYSNIQKDVTVIGANGSPSGIVANVTAATIQGVEFEGSLQPVAGVTLGVNFDYTDAHFNGRDTGAGTANDPCDPNAALVLGFCPRNRISYTPKVQFGVSLDYALPLVDRVGKVTLGGHFYHQSSIALTDTSVLNPESIQKGYNKLDLDVSWNAVFGKPVDLRFFMTNVTSTLYKTGVDDLLQSSSIGVNAVIWAPPRMFGFGAKYHF